MGYTIRKSRNLKIDGEITASTKSYNIHAKNALLGCEKRTKIVSDQPIQSGSGVYGRR